MQMPPIAIGGIFFWFLKHYLEVLKSEVVFEGEQRIARLHQVREGTHHTFAKAISTNGSGIGDIPDWQFDLPGAFCSLVN